MESEHKNGILACLMEMDDTIAKLLSQADALMYQDNGKWKKRRKASVNNIGI